jgi:hypothetical protein
MGTVTQRQIFIGWDPREAAAFAVARSSIRRHLTQPMPIRGLVLQQLIDAGLYTRPTTTKINGEGRFEMVDVLSIRADYDGRVSTQHANARFFVPHLAGTGWALFMDGDMLVRGNLARVFEALDPAKAVYCVPHDHQAQRGAKMDGQLQTAYSRKNWSSFILFNCDHPANHALTLDLVNTVPGRDLHRLCWLTDEGLIGHLGPEWNWLVGESAAIDNPKVVHFTSGVPDMPGYENCAYADEWRAELNRWAA